MVHILTRQSFHVGDQCVNEKHQTTILANELLLKQGRENVDVFSFTWSMKAITEIQTHLLYVVKYYLFLCFQRCKCVIQHSAGCYGKNLSGISVPHKGVNLTAFVIIHFQFFVRANCEGRKKIIFCITQLSLSKENDLVKFVDSEHYLSHAVCVVDHH